MENANVQTTLKPITNAGIQHSVQIIPHWKLFLSVAILLGVLPFIMSTYLLSVMVMIGFFAIAAVGVTLLMGYGGLVTLAQAGFWGVGAYTSAILCKTLGYPPLLSIFLSMVGSGLVAYIIGKLTIRLNGHHFSLATLGFVIVINIIMQEQGKWTGGPSGMANIPPLSMNGFILQGDWNWYYVIWAVTLVCIFLLNNLVKSSWGRNLRSMHASKTAAEAMGVQTSRYRLQAFIICAVLAGLSGGLYAHYMGFISPSLFSFQMSIEFIVMAVVGGLGAIWGGMIGTIVMMFLLEGLRTWIPNLFANPSSVGAIEVTLFGVLLIVMIIFMPKGIIGALQTIGRKWRNQG